MRDGKGGSSVEDMSDLDLDCKQEVEEKLLAVGRERRVTGRGEGCVPGVTVAMAVCLGTTGWAAGGRGEGAGPEHEGPERPGRRGLRPAETGGCRLVWGGQGGWSGGPVVGQSAQQPGLRCRGQGESDRKRPTAGGGV